MESPILENGPLQNLGICPCLGYSTRQPCPTSNQRGEMSGETPKGLSFKRQGQSRTLAINSWATGELRVAVSYPRAIEKRTAPLSPAPTHSES